ncbi:hypothetical protein EYF80_011107 [Liparis tanakae]|uniref:Uncharacterized protein n=1 Tax=Liparis tanakae TaxID=230148 RepID=A0A4Z2ING3_9TELE|nr:hypothetical protein EYF80_011107 [Liparis tanakae]
MRAREDTAVLVGHKQRGSFHRHQGLSTPRRCASGLESVHLLRALLRTETLDARRGAAGDEGAQRSSAYTPLSFRGGERRKLSRRHRILLQLVQDH